MSSTDEIHREYTLACTHAAGYTRRMHERAYFSSLACPPGEILDRRTISDINDFREQVIARVRKFRCDAIQLLRIAIDQPQRTPLRQTPGEDAAHATTPRTDDEVSHCQMPKHAPLPTFAE